MFLTHALCVLTGLTSFRGSGSSFFLTGTFFLLLESQSLFLSLNGSCPLSTGACSSDKLTLSLCFLTLMVVLLIELTPLINLSIPLGLSTSLAFLALILSMAFTSISPLFFYVMFEASLIPISIMILGWGYQPERLAAVMAMMLYTMLASLPLLLALLHQTSAGQVSFQLNTEMSLLASQAGFWLSVCTFLAFLVKLPMFAVHLWLPKAHVEAPVSGSMFLAALLLKLGGFGIWRMASMVSNLTFSSSLQAFSLLGGASISFLCLRQTDIKVLIAYSSVAHMSLALACLLSPSSMATLAGMYMLLAHGISSSAMFGAANLLYLQFSSRNLLLMGGSLSLLPTFALFWFLIVAANMAAPPTANLVAEICSITYLLSSAVVAAIIFGSISFLAAAYSLLLYASPLQGQRESLSVSSAMTRPLNCLFLLLHVVFFFLLLCFF